jgi:hypothetical protein
VINNSLGGQSGNWRRATGCAASSSGHSTPTAMQYTDSFCGYAFGSSAGRVTSPLISLAGYAAPFTLNFKYWLDTEDPSLETAAVYVSPNGSTWYLAAENLPPGGVTALSDPSSGWRSASIDISSVVSTQVYVLVQFNGEQFFAEGFGFYFDDVEVTGVPDVDTSEIWVDFAHTGTELGSESFPFNTLSEGAAAVDAGGIVKIVAGDSAETVTISKAKTVPGEFAVPERGGSVRTPEIGARVEPSLLVAPGLVLARPDARLSVLLQAEAPIDPASIWHVLQAEQDQAAEVYWEAEDGDMRRVWVRCTPAPRWVAGDVISLTAGAQTVDGVEVAPVTWAFEIPE